MKVLFYLIAALVPTAALYAQSVQEKVILGPNYADQVWYSLENGVVKTEPKDNWDLAFEMNGFNAAILANTQKGLEVYQSPNSVDRWDNIDTTGITTWLRLYDSDTSWSIGALNHFLADEFDLGWGVYNLTTHAVNGDSVFVLKLADGTWKKLMIDGLISGVYSFTYANIDGSDERSVDVRKTDFSRKNFGYYSLERHEQLDREPPASDWDLTFTRYVAFIPAPYPVVGVLLNSTAQCQRAAGVETAQASPNEEQFATVINAIGYDWKRFDLATNTYIMEDSLSFFVRNESDRIWKIVFTSYEGSATGSIGFTKEATSLSAENAAAFSVPVFEVYPNPVLGGSANLLYTLPAGRGEIAVFDLLGRVRMQTTLEPAPRASQLPLRLAGLESGTYMVRMTTPRGVQMRRLVVQ